MHHYIYAMHSEGAAPAGDGNIKAWFEYYKLGNGPGTSIAFYEKDMPEEELAVAGDYLWFGMDDVLIGACHITSVEPDPLNKRVDVFYDSSAVTNLQIPWSSLVCGRASGESLHWLTEIYKGFMCGV